MISGTRIMAAELQNKLVYQVTTFQNQGRWKDWQVEDVIAEENIIILIPSVNNTSLRMFLSF